MSNGAARTRRKHERCRNLRCRSERRRLDQDYDPKHLGSVGILRPYSRELGDLLRRQIREIRDRDLRQDGKRWLDTKTGEEFEIIRSHVDPVAAADSLAEAFCVRDGLVVYLKPKGARQEPRS